MATGHNRPIIIKRKKITGGDGHHGGAWKVAYADFVTAMMAFFMLMWLLNATTEQQRSGIADYFSPTIPISQNSGGGDGIMAGDSLQASDTMIQTGSGGLAERENGAGPGVAEAVETRELRQLEQALLGLGGESFEMENALKHVLSRLTDEGLVIELFDRPEASLFDGPTATPNPVTRDLARMLARVLRLVDNGIAVRAHLARTEGMDDAAMWSLSLDRARTFAALTRDGGLAPERIARLSGRSDRDPATVSPEAPRNNRIELIVLRESLYRD
ncbi:chemotaxis protein MotB [Salipiger sp. IMCC34102]|uniref:flagellar motor protein MotB n=1 Tax=Salipiger sp. IMCC34102 TaxID=2510647 RepID=UPI00101B9B35|nr:flagellar motor protein MotB [Salipiger sp. IMCC34102]RYH03873.1 chemotaxis protein MotB [Salipiger sp. IMCC34102]